MIKFILAATSLLISIGLLLYSTISPEMRKSGVLTITLERPRLMLYKRAVGLPNNLDGASNSTSAINAETKVTAIISQATADLDTLFRNAPKEITLGCDQICYRNPGEICRDIPPNLLAWFPSPLDTLINLNNLPPGISAILKISIRTCLLVSLESLFLLAVSFTALLFLDDEIPRSLTFRYIRLAIEIVAGILVFCFLTLPAVITFTLTTRLPRLGVKVADGDLAIHLAAILVLLSFWSVLFYSLRRI